MKKIFQLIFAIILTLKLSAQAPQKFSYQAVIRNASNNLVTNAQVKMRISILQGSSSGTVVYSEIHSPTTNVNGLASVEIGSGTNQTGSFANINWGSGTFFLKTETDPANGTNYSVVGSTQLLSTPYALYAAQSANGVPGTSNLGDMLYWDGSKWQKIPVGKFGQSLKINNQTLPSWTGDSYAVVQTLPVTNIKGNTFTGNMNLVSMGLNNSEPKTGYPYKGVCWGRNPNPILVSGNYISDTFSTPGNYSFNIGSQQNLFNYTIKLLYNTKYYVRAFASNGAGIIYGNEVSFTTENGPLDYPNIGYFNTYNTKDSSFDFYYYLQEEGTPITSTGVVWSTSPDPTIDLPTKTSNTITNNYVSGTIKGLKPYTQYYVRPYAVNVVGVAYGNEDIAVTSGTPPTIVTTPITSLTANTANMGGNITADGGTPVISRGVIYSKNVISATNQYNFNSASVQSGSGLGDYTTEITSLTPNTTYYARAFATNIAGTFYGNQISFRTLDGPAVTLPQNDELWLVGGASDGGWNNPLPEPYLTSQKFTKLSSTKYELVTNLKPNEGYLILPVMGSWASSYRLEDNVYRQANVDSGRFVLKTSGGQDFLSPAVGGIYRITLDFKRGMFNLTNQETAPVFNPVLNYGMITDIDQNIYKTIQIGTQTWMAENLKVTRYRNGVLINNIADNTQWQSNTAGAWSYYNNNLTNNAQYGKLYNWFAVNNTNKICPTGWHVPTDAEWTVLENFLGGSSVSGGKMKSQGISYWSSPNTGADNSSGFSSLPGGYRLDAGTYQGTNSEGIWWSASEASSANAWYRYLAFNRFDGFRANFDKGSGFSVRCVKD